MSGRRVKRGIRAVVIRRHQDETSRARPETREKTINYLEAYDKESGFLVREYRLDIDLDDLKRMLDIDPDLEVFGYPVPDSLVPEVGKYSEESVVFDESCNYMVGFFRQ
ncbi:DUF7683 domain-containing protein [Rhodococcus triatomae]